MKLMMMFISMKPESQQNALAKTPIDACSIKSAQKILPCLDWGKVSRKDIA